MKIIIEVVLLFYICALTVDAQTSINKVVLSSDSKDAVVGAYVFEKDLGSKNAIVTGMDGRFEICTSSLESLIEVAYIGYENAIVPSSEPQDTIWLNPSDKQLADVTIYGQVVTNRKSPIAASTVNFIDIEDRLGNQEFTEVLKYTPGVHSNRQGGGWCDSEIYMRGFDNSNIAVMINGISMNDMENGSVYWSNWAGISDVAAMVQTQRGIGASKVSSPSIGGTINIVTKGSERLKGGSAYYMVGNDGYRKVSFNLNSGLVEKGWAISLLGSKTWGDGYVQGTAFSAYNYYLNITKLISDNHQLTLLVFGSPQTHYGRSNALTKSEWDKVKNYSCNYNHWSRFNPDYGFDKNGNRKTADYNEYHMPQIFLNHVWQINHKSSLSSSMYASFGRGNGYSGDANSDVYSEYSWYGSDYGKLNMEFRKEDGTVDYGRIEDINLASSNGSELILTKQIGTHDWYGLVSTYDNKLNDNINLQVGLDCRLFKATHSNEIVDLFGGDYYVDYYRKDVKADLNPKAADENWVNQHLGKGDIVHRDYDSYIRQMGVFAQCEYSKDNISAFISGSLNRNAFWRYDRLYYSPDKAESDKAKFTGGNIKAGINYNLNSFNNVFFNIGYITRTPKFKNGVFMSANNSNLINKDVKNEQSFSTEIGYGFHSKFFTTNVNGYITRWCDKTMTKKGKMKNKEQYYMNMTGVDALHMGVEIEAKAKPFAWLDANAMLSIGKWEWDSDDVKGYAYSVYGQALTPEGTTTTSQSPDHAWAIIKMKGVKVGGSAQTTAAVEMMFKPIENFSIGGGYNWYANNYAYYSIGGGDLSLGKEMVVSEPWKMPNSGFLDMRASYKYKFDKFALSVSGKVNNVLNKYHIEKAWNPSNVDTEVKKVNPDDVYMFYSPGRTWNVSLKLTF